MSYENVINELTSQGKFYIDLGLERCQQVLKLLGNPQDKINAIQVAGTNGKGSCCAMLDSVLREAGYKTGLYTSPHIFEYTERIKIDGNEISKSDFEKYFNLVISTSEKHKIHLTEFEILTVMMYKYFADNEVEIGIIETGLGGRLDATNVLKRNICSVITHIDFDHTDRLGTTKLQIASEKAGIIKPDSAVITSEGFEVIKDKADELGALFVLANPCVNPEFYQALSLKGQNQIENLALVIATLELKFNHISQETIIEGLKKVKHDFRFQYFPEKNMIIDGAHNPDCVKSLILNLYQYYADKKHRFVFGCLKTKDYKSMLREITNDVNVENIYVYEFKNGNSCDIETLQSATDYELKKLSSLNNINFSDDILTVVCGSFYMLKELLSSV
jgi:dihydrofolate synthase/folylpolyglutamate synthase